MKWGVRIMTSRRFSIVSALGLFLALAMIVIGCSTSASGPSSSGAGSSAATPNASTSNTGTAPAGHAVVTIKDFSFSPATVTVPVGTRVVWQNKGKATHTVTFDDGSVTSPDIAPGASASHVFSSPGTFAYHCSHHPQMKGTVIVQ